MDKTIGIDTIEEININVVNQFVSIKASNIENPLF